MRRIDPHLYDHLRDRLEEVKAERDEARHWARRMMQERDALKFDQAISGLASVMDNIELVELRDENAALRRELETAAADALDARKAWGVAESECMRLRRELDTLRPRQ